MFFFLLAHSLHPLLFGFLLSPSPYSSLNLKHTTFIISRDLRIPNTVEDSIDNEAH